MLSCGKEEGLVQLWDLRKMGVQGPLSIKSEASTMYAEVSYAGRVSFDNYGGFFGAAGKVVEVYKSKSGAKVAQIPINGIATDIRFTAKNRRILVATADGALKVLY